MRKPPWIPFAFLAALAFALAPASAQELVTERFGEPLGAAETAHVDLRLSGDDVAVFALDDPTRLIDAELLRDGGTTIDFQVEGEDEKRISLQRSGGRPDLRINLPGGEQPQWTIGLNPEVPLELRIDAAGGASNLDLTGINVSALRLGVGDGDVEVALPAAATRYAAEIVGGQGRSRVAVTEGADLDLAIETGGGDVSVALGADLDLTLTIHGGGGSSTVDLPADTAVRVEVTGRGGGAVRIGDALAPTDADGVWESAGFASASRRITILVAEVRGGDITIR